MNSTTLIQVVSRYCGVFDYLDLSRLARLLVVLDTATMLAISICLLHMINLRLAYSECQSASQYVVELCEELSLEHAVDKWIRFRW